MKTIVIFLLLNLSIATPIQAESANDLVRNATDLNVALIASSVVTKTVSNLFVIFRYENGGANHTVFRSDEPIRFGFSSATNITYNIFLIDPEFGFRISARSPNGEPLKTTRLGANFGKKFGEIKGYDKSKLDMSRRPKDQHPDRERPYAIQAPQSFSLTRSFPPSRGFVQI